MRVAVVTPIPTPYRDPFWNEVARQPNVELSVFYCSAGKSDRPWSADWPRRYHYEVLAGYNLARWRGADRSCFWNPSIRTRLRDGRYDAILIGGYNHLTMLAAMHEARRMTTPYYLMCETYKATGRQSLFGRVKKNVVRTVLSNATGTFPTGILAAKYLQEAGADPTTMTYLPNVPDVMALSRPQDLSVAPDGSGSDPRPIVLFVGRLIPKKRADLLIRAFHAIGQTTDARLVLVGDGPMRAQLAQMTAALGLESRVHFAGFAQPSEVARWYAAAKVFVMPSSETWGVAVIEALASGVPVVVSDEVGCHPDVVNDPCVGKVVPARNQKELSAGIACLLAENSSHERVTRAWAPIRESFRFDRIARQLSERINATRSDSVPTSAAALS